MMDSTIISRVMKIKSKRVQMKEMQSWTPEEQVRHLCPEGVIMFIKRLKKKMSNEKKYKLDCGSL